MLMKGYKYSTFPLFILLQLYIIKRIRNLRDVSFIHYLFSIHLTTLTGIETI
jgi:hypothetical protein